METSSYAPSNDRHFLLRHSSGKCLQQKNFLAHDVYEINYFLSGNIRYHFEDSTYPLQVGDLLFIPPDTLHRMTAEDKEQSHDRVVLSLSREYFTRLTASLDKSIYQDKMALRLSRDKEEHRLLSYILRRLFVLDNSPACLLERDCLCTLLLLQLQHNTPALPENQAHPQLHQEIIRYINAHFTEQVSLEHIANHFYISKVHLQRLFKSYTQTTIHNYILGKRIVLAKALLAENVPPSRVAVDCGFGSYAGFYQAFLKQTGQTPSDFVGKRK